MKISYSKLIIYPTFIFFLIGMYIGAEWNYIAGGAFIGGVYGIFVRLAEIDKQKNNVKEGAFLIFIFLAFLFVTAIKLYKINA